MYYRRKIWDETKWVLGHDRSTWSEWKKTTSLVGQNISWPTHFCFISELISKIHHGLFGLNPDFALYGTKNLYVRTDNGFLSLSEVSTRTLTLLMSPEKTTDAPDFVPGVVWTSQYSRIQAQTQLPLLSSSQETSWLHDFRNQTKKQLSLNISSQSFNNSPLFNSQAIQSDFPVISGHNNVEHNCCLYHWLV